MLLFSVFLCIWKWNKQREISSWSQYMTGTICNLLRHPVTWQRELKPSAYVCLWYFLADRCKTAPVLTHPHLISLSASLSLFLILQNLLVGYLSFLPPLSCLYIMMKRSGRTGIAGTGARCWGKQRIFSLFIEHMSLIFDVMRLICAWNRKPTDWYFPGTDVLNAKYQREALCKTKAIWCPSWRIKIQFIVSE